ncbi:hypothetical protein PPS11_22074 [Pseudomonas putida S11]|nr:hypothetical protein PPS11_22074 [Pseudomonas putida S11]
MLSLPKKAAPVQRRRGQRTEHQGDQRGQAGHLQRQLYRFQHIGPGKGHGEPLQGKAFGREAERRVFGVEGIQEDDQDREVQEQ